MRLYHFKDWLLFAMDQSRDAMLISKAVEQGASYLPLLGPRAAGTYLRLGPAFYYLEYLSAKIFHSVDPYVFAIPDLFFGILSIVLMYLLLRLYFERFISLLVVLLYAVSFIAVQYSRFAWNPNSMPFWSMLAFYSFLRAFTQEQKVKRNYWLVLGALAGGILTQLHFFAFFMVPAAIIVLIIWSGAWRRIGFSGALIILFVLFLLYLPVIISDIKTGGDNLKQLNWALFNKPNQNSFLSLIFQNFINHGQYYLLMLTSFQGKTLAGLSVYVGLTFFVFSTLLLVRAYWQEQDNKRSLFLKAVLSWLAVSFLIFTPVAFQVRPRFFLISLPLAFIFLALVYDFLKQIKPKKLSIVVISLISLVIFLVNLESVFAWFKAVQVGKAPNLMFSRKLAVSTGYDITVNFIERIADVIKKRQAETGKKAFIYGKMPYREPVEYFLRKKQPTYDFELISRTISDREALYFAIVTEKGGFDSIEQKYREKFDEVASFTTGPYLLIEMKLKDVQPEISKKNQNNNKTQNSKDKLKKPKRKDRVFWNDIE